MHINLYQKKILVTFFVITAFLIEFFSKLTINFNLGCHEAFFKLEFLPMILVGFLFGFKYAFFINLLFLLGHFFLEIIVLHPFIMKDLSASLYFVFFIFKFFLPYMFSTFSGFFHIKDLKKLQKKQLFYKIIFTFSIIIIFNIIAVIIFVVCYFQAFAAILHLDHVFSWFQNEFIHSLPRVVYSVFYICSIVINNVIIAIITFFLIPRLRFYLNDLDFS